MRTVCLMTLAWMLTGCLSAPEVSHTVLDRLAGLPQGPDVIMLDIAVIEQPPADSYLDGDLWPAVDEQPVPLDRKAALEDNGFRVGVIGGMPAPRLQELLTSDRWCQAHRVTTRINRVKALPIGPAQGECEFDLHAEGGIKPQKFNAAQFGFNIVPSYASEGRVKLLVTPQVTHGGKSIWIHPSEGDNWSLKGQRPVEQWAGLNFEVTLGAQEYLLIGTRFDRDRTIGRMTFVDVSEAHPAQRLLVIRARPQDDVAKSPWKKASDAPLAAQASQTVRGTAE